MRRQGRSVQELQWRAPCGEWGSYLSIFVFIAVMICQIVSACLPPVLESAADMSRIGLAFQGMLGVIIFGVLYFGRLIYVAYKGDGDRRQMFLIPLDDIALPELDASVSSEEVGASREKNAGHPVNTA